MKNIRLFWWNEAIIMNKPKENYGDLLGKYLVEKISGKKVVFAWPKKFSIYDWFSPIYVTIGSILANVNPKCIVWGSGIIQKDQQVKSAKFLAVRGPQTRANLIRQGYEVPEVYGDPALLLSRYYNPNVVKKYKLGIIPHYRDYQEVFSIYGNNEHIKIINLMTNNVESTTIEILECESTLSSSLHGIIVSHAYQIPSIWIKFSDKPFGDDIKYRDYFESVDIQNYKPIEHLDFNNPKEIETIFKNYPNCPSVDKLNEVCKNLMEVCPFKQKS